MSVFPGKWKLSAPREKQRVDKEMKYTESKCFGADNQPTKLQSEWSEA